MKDETFAEYMPHIRQRWLDEQRGWEERRERAWELARRAAEILHQAGATHVLAFGSLTRTGMYDARSDIDLAEVGIPPEKFWDGLVDAMKATGDFELDVVDLTHCQPSLRETILREGITL